MDDLNKNVINLRTNAPHSNTLDDIAQRGFQLKVDTAEAAAEEIMDLLLHALTEFGYVKSQFADINLIYHSLMGCMMRELNSPEYVTYDFANKLWEICKHDLEADKQPDPE